MFIVPATWGTRGPPMSIVVAKAQGPAHAAQKAASESRNTATCVLSTSQAPSIAIEQIPRDEAPTPLRLTQRLPVRRQIQSVSSPPQMPPKSGPPATTACKYPDVSTDTPRVF